MPRDPDPRRGPSAFNHGAASTRRSDGTDRRCVAICQYANDPETYGCATHPALGVREDCSRVNARVFVDTAEVLFYTTGDLAQGMACSKVATAADVVPARAARRATLPPRARRSLP